MEQRPTIPPPPPTDDRCYRHPDQLTGVHCTRCGRPICPECMIPAPVGHQCPDCIAEARKEFRKGPGRRIAVANAKATSATVLMVIALAAVYLWETVQAGAGSIVGGPSPGEMVELGGMFSPAVAFGGQYWRLFTSMFLHYGLLHIGLNALMLYLIGVRVETDFGRARFLAIYLLSGLAGSVATYLFEPPLGTVSAGASGAVFGVLGALLAYAYPRRHSAVGRATVSWVWQILLINLLFGLINSSIGLAAHIGGFVGGIVFGVLLDEDGPLRLPRAGRWIGVLGAIGLGVAVTLWRTASLQAQFGL